MAIITEIKKSHPEAEIRFITDKRFFVFSSEKMKPLGISVSKVSAGKFRRYANLKWYDHFKHIFISYIPNLVDVFKFFIGFLQSLCKIIIFRPDVVFSKGGYVGLPVGLAASILRRPLVIHDSDAIPGLTNRILGKYAIKIGLGMPQENSNYDKSKTEYVGIPIDERYSKTSEKEKAILRKKYIDASNLPVILALGGSLGSRVINEEVVEAYPDIKGKAEVFLVTGNDHYTSVKSVIDNNKRKYLGLRILPFISGEIFFDLMGLSDIVITRAGATTIAELAAGHKPTIIIPSPYLASDHQSKNAELLAESDAAIIIKQENLKQDFTVKINELIDSKQMRGNLGDNIHKFASNNAAEKMAKIIIGAGKNAKK